MTFDHISASLPWFRDLLSKGWSPATAYPGSVDRDLWTPGDPRGQCGVSSVWLTEMLAFRYNIDSKFCRGALRFDAPRAQDLLDHCWVEFSVAGGETLVLDVTCDQAANFNSPYLLESKEVLAHMNIRFSTRDRIRPHELRKNRVWPRYLQLVQNLQMLTASAEAG